MRFYSFHLKPEHPVICRRLWAADNTSKSEAQLVPEGLPGALRAPKAMVGIFAIFVKIDIL